MPDSYCQGKTYPPSAIENVDLSKNEHLFLASVGDKSIREIGFDKRF